MQQHERNEVETRARTVQDMLTRFARLVPEERDKIVVNLVHLLKTSVTKEVIEALADKQFQEDLRRACGLALNTPFEVDGEEIKPWNLAGGHTVVAVDQDLRVLGFSSTPTPGLEDYGDLTPYATVKAVLDWDSHNAGRGSLDSVASLRHYRKLGLQPVKDVFMGSVMEPVKVGEHTVFLGGSGCAVKYNYLCNLLEVDYTQHGTQAGRHDGIFCDLVGMYLAEPSLPARPVPEPLRVQEIRWGN